MSLPGATKVSGGINFAVEVPADEEASLILYHKGEAEPAEEIPFTEANRTGRMCAMMVSGFKPEQYEYNFRIDTKVCSGSVCLWSDRKRSIWQNNR